MERKILADHKKIGKVFQPPIILLGTFLETAWIDFAVPEFFWIYLLFKQNGKRESHFLFLEFVKITDNYLSNKINAGIGYSFASSYNLISDFEKKEIIKELRGKNVLAKIQPSLKIFLNLYPTCPLSFLNVDKLEEDDQSNYLLEFKISLKDFLDKTSVGSTIVMAHIISSLNFFGRLQVVDTGLPELEKILEYPVTDDSKRLAAFLRATIPTFFNIENGYDRQNYWLSVFWNRSYKLEPIIL